MTFLYKCAICERKYKVFNKKGLTAHLQHFHKLTKKNRDIYFKHRLPDGTFQTFPVEEKCPFDDCNITFKNPIRKFIHQEKVHQVALRGQQYFDDQLNRHLGQERVKCL